MLAGSGLCFVPPYPVIARRVSRENRRGNLREVPTKHAAAKRLPRRSRCFTPRNDKPDGLRCTNASPTIGEVVRASEPEGCQTNETDCIYETLTPLSFAPLSSSPIVGEPRDTDCHVGLRPPRNDKIGTAVLTMSLRGFEEAVAISGKYRQGMQLPKDCHGRVAPSQ